MRVTLDLNADSLARLAAEAERRDIELETVIDELAARLAPPGGGERSCSGLIGLGASSTELHAADADALLDDGFGRD